ncbi:MAG: hypothetical protein AAFV80_07075 [Bacteroidota bacterium]
MKKHPLEGSCPSDEQMRYWLQLMVDPDQASLSDQPDLNAFQTHLQTCSICQSATAGLLKWLANEGRLPERKALPMDLRDLLC